ncbi:MAG TPA: oligosaccharide flippase family protein [Rubrivivax sp.]|nr:oligosaccharide flippase family protein [Rubrivivax sp.]
MVQAGLGRDTWVLVTGLAAAQGVMLAVMPVWSRLYGPDEFAALGVWMAVVAVVSMLLLLRYDTCIVIAADDAEGRALLRLCLLLASFGGVLWALAAWGLPERLRDAWGLQPLGRWLPLAVLAGALAAMFAALLGWANRTRRYPQMTLARLMLAAVAALAGCLLGGVAGGLLWAHLVGAVAGLAAMLFTVRWRGPAGDMEAAARRHVSAPRYLWPAAMLDAITQQLPMLLAVAWFSQQQAGQFSLAWRVTAVPVLMLASAAGTVFYQSFAQLGGDPAAARAALWLQWRRFALLGALPSVLLLAFGGPLFAAVFGPTWREAGWLAAALTPMLFAMLISSPTSGALIVLGLQKWSPLFGIAMLVYRPVALWLGARQGSLLVGLALWAVAEVIAIVLYNGLLLRRLRPAATLA